MTDRTRRLRHTGRVSRRESSTHIAELVRPSAAIVSCAPNQPRILVRDDMRKVAHSRASVPTSRYLAELRTEAEPGSLVVDDMR